MRTIADIDRELELLVAVRRSITVMGGGRLNTRSVDRLLDERLELQRCRQPAS